MALKNAKKHAKPKVRAKAKTRARTKAKNPRVKAKVNVKAKAAAKPMPKKELHYFEKRLMEERHRVLKELGHHDEIFNTSQQASDGDLSAYSFHMADQGTDAMEREKAFLFASQEGRFLWHIDQALRRLYKSPATFGKCHNCGNDIAHDRLDALPHARYCIECKQREEDGKR